MNRRWKVGLLSLMVGFLVWVVYQNINQHSVGLNKSKTEESSEISETGRVKQHDQNGTDALRTEADVNIEPNQQSPEDVGLPEIWPIDWRTQLAQRRYSEDITVELSSIAMEYESCGNADLSWRFENQQLTQVQDEIKTAVEKYCADLSSTYPLLENNQIKNGMRMVFNHFPATSELGQFFQQQISETTRLDLQNFVTDLIPLSIKAKNSQTLIMAEWVGGFGNRYQTFDPAIIGSQNKTYLDEVQSIALTALSCEYQAGITCAPTSRFMQDKCFSNDRFCGQDFKQWYAQSVTPGLAQDVEILKQHYLRAVQR